MKLRLRNIDESEGVYISQKEIESIFFPYPKYDCKTELQKLVEKGQIRMFQKPNKATGHMMYMYEVLQAGAMDLKLIKPQIATYDTGTLQMIQYIKNVTIDHVTPELPPYFNAFLKFRNEYMSLFFTVDTFSGRIHTPITSLKSEIRERLLIDKIPTTGIDVVTMQPLLLGKILKQTIGPNDFSNWIESGEDIYTMLQLKSGLKTRAEGKERFFKIAFALPNNELSLVFGNADWINWINHYKRQLEPRNPHSINKPHSNLAWLLQSTEVRLMRKVWTRLMMVGIPFLTVHDEIIVKNSDLQRAEYIVRSVLDQEFSFYKLNTKGLPVVRNQIQYVPKPAPSNVRRDFVGTDGLIHTYIPY
jgi:hypothetical protein